MFADDESHLSLTFDVYSMIVPGAALHEPSPLRSIVQNLTGGLAE